MSASEVIELEEKKDIQGLIAVVEYAKNKNAVKHAIIVLGELKDKRAVEPLIYKALKCELQTLRKYAIISLGNIMDVKAVKPLIHILQDKDDIFRGLAEIALCKIATEEALMNVISFNGGKLGDIASSVLKEIGEPAIKPLISILGGGDETIREEIVTILGEIGNKKATEALITVVENTKEHSDIREKGVHALGKIKDSKAVVTLINIATEDTDLAIRCWSATALGDIGDIRAEEALLALLQDKSGRQEMRLRGHVAEALGKIGDWRTVEPLIKVLEDNREHEFVRHCAAWALLQLDEEKIAYPLLKYLKKKKNVINMNNPIGDIR
jgi:HEAT repeat protein